jgi:putative transcriptional regulator
MPQPHLLAQRRLPGYLDGQCLVAMPGMEDPRFKRSVVYICAHSGEGAMGIVINHTAPNVTFPDLLVQLKILPEGADILVPEQVSDVPVVAGGPVEQARGFLLHTSDVMIRNSTLDIADGICLTATLDILKAIAQGRGPRRSMLALGYAGWSAGQLEAEIQRNGWLTCPADAQLVFGGDMGAKYTRALARIGVDPALLSSQAGHA